MVIQVIIRLTLYVDQAILREGEDLANENLPGIKNTVKTANLRQFVCNSCT